MRGRWVWMNGRRIFFPPFSNELFGTTPFWACTFATMINAADVGFLGEIDRERISKGETRDEVIKRLARKSGDPTKHQGSTTSEMATAMAKKYGQKLHIVHDTPDLGRRRLKHGKVLVAGLFYKDLPKHYRRHSPNFEGGHRVLYMGWRDGKNDPNDGDTRILDPLANKGSNYIGEWIPWSAVTDAYWADEQVWVAPGQYLPDAKVKVEQRFDPARTFRIDAGVPMRAFMPQGAGVAKKVTFAVDRTGKFDAVVKVSQPTDAHPDRPEGRFIRIVEGPFNGMLLDPQRPGLTASIQPDAVPVPVELLLDDDDPIADDLSVGDLPPATVVDETRRTGTMDEVIEVDPDPPADDVDDVDDLDDPDDDDGDTV